MKNCNLNDRLVTVVTVGNSLVLPLRGNDNQQLTYVVTLVTLSLRNNNTYYYYYIISLYLYICYCYLLPCYPVTLTYILMILIALYGNMGLLPPVTAVTSIKSDL